MIKHKPRLSYDAMTRQELKKRLKNLGLSYHDANQIALWYERQLSCRGAKGAIQLLKAFGDSLHWAITRAGEKPDNWISCKGCDQMPALVWKMDYPDSVWLRISKFARSVRLKEIIQEQVDKVYNAIIVPYSGSDESLNTMCKFIELGAGPLSNVKAKFGKPPLVMREFRRILSYSTPHPSPVSRPPFLESLIHMSRNPFLMDLPWWKDVFYPVSTHCIEDMVEHVQESLLGKDGFGKISALLAQDIPDLMGHYGTSQEGAGKLRAYASPYTVIQCLLDPIKDWISCFLRQVSTDCTYDQDAGARWVQSKLNSDVTIYSVDLSTATCRFPLKPQLNLLAQLGMPQEILNVLSRVCKGSWLVGPELKPFGVPDYLRWNVGQPLGISPSIRMFSLTHNLLLQGICLSLKVNPSETFRVLGDDVVIANPEVYSIYSSILDGCSVPISYHKSWISSDCAEFAGYQITRTDMVRPGQWRKPTPMNYIGLAEHLGCPTKGEVGSLELLAQKLHLFRSGNFEPPSNLYTLFLKASYLFDGIDEFLGFKPDYSTKPILWFNGAKSEILSQLEGLYKLQVHLNWNHSYYDDFLGSVTRVLQSYSNSFSSLPSYMDNNHIQAKLLDLFVIILSLPDLSLNQRHDCWKEVMDKYRESLWLTPMSVSKAEKEANDRYIGSIKKALVLDNYKDVVETCADLFDSDFYDLLQWGYPENDFEFGPLTTDLVLKRLGQIGAI